MRAIKNCKQSECFILLSFFNQKYNRKHHVHLGQTIEHHVNISSFDARSDNVKLSIIMIVISFHIIYTGIYT